MAGLPGPWACAPCDGVPGVTESLISRFKRQLGELARPPSQRQTLQTRADAQSQAPPEGAAPRRRSARATAAAAGHVAGAGRRAESNLASAGPPPRLDGETGPRPRRGAAAAQIVRGRMGRGRVGRRRPSRKRRPAARANLGTAGHGPRPLRGQPHRAARARRHHVAPPDEEGPRRARDRARRPGRFPPLAPGRCVRRAFQTTSPAVQRCQNYRKRTSSRRVESLPGVQRRQNYRKTDFRLAGSRRPGAAAACIVRGRVAAAPRLPRGYSVDESRRDCRVDRPRADSSVAPAGK